MHTIDLEPYQHSGTNITGIRIVDPASELMKLHLAEESEEEKNENEDDVPQEEGEEEEEHNEEDEKEEDEPEEGEKYAAKEKNGPVCLGKKLSI